VSTETNLAEVLHRRAIQAPNGIAYTFLADGAADARSLTWSELDVRAAAIAATLRDRKATGQPILLALPSGLAFVESLFACWYAGAIAVPISIPRHQRLKHRLDRILADAGARFGIASAATRDLLQHPDAHWIDPTVARETPASTAPSPTAPHQTALLQYTSGSTGYPRGVIVSHANLMHNSGLIADACGHEPGHTIAGWLPLFHDMGLIGLVLQAAFSGARCVFMAPERFLMRPWLWLQMISDYKVRSSPAPNFAYDFCTEKVVPEHKTGLDLSCWRNALNGSEPVRPATLQRFASAFADCQFNPESFFPCYGLAESTLFVTGPRQTRRVIRRSPTGKMLADDEPGGHVACGQAFGNTQIQIVDPTTSRPVSPGTIGEIWLAGESSAHGYWNNPAATAETFHARLHGDANARWLRTGDLGFLADEQLFVTGRLRELIIIAGRNLFPVDIERTVENANPAIAAAAAFAIQIDGIEKLVVAAELRRHGRDIDADSIFRQIRAAVVTEHDVAPHDTILLIPGGIPRTTSGKISRRFTHDAYLANTLNRLETARHVHAR
jgi:acyl-CoA synthetase (AMP-forming)/AMP-acid ligase II